ncbi:AraC family transcriptional regulator [Novosphingobium sediminis]|uniref:AraC family transcriptional regulator n=1 Tax=Novosphingobium sediminis TaxID=707214 RepID=A0A512AJC4_9SPHN|nr:helix-turn-helix domain-containing protein [Novosphingobium sediminis]GEN99805.1 AraC family transcriptional regulator [Novosphingobium sediminis]
MLRVIGLFLFADFQILDVVGPLTSFEVAERFVSGSYSTVLLSAEGGAVRSSAGVPLETISIAEAPALDTLIVSGGDGSRTAMHHGATSAWLRRVVEVRRVCSVCSGAFLLAAAGLLDGRRATTHWRRAEQLARLFPAIAVEPDRIHIRDGHVWTSAGITAGIDLALALIAEDLGEETARRVAQEMVVYYRRPGGQSQFSALADLGGQQTPFAPLLEWIRSHLDQRLTVEILAERCAMSPRNFSRAFTREMGVSPARVVERLRLEVARERVEGSPQPIEHIAATLGFHDPERMRRAFLRAFGQPPQAMRRLARAQTV